MRVQRRRGGAEKIYSEFRFSPWYDALMSADALEAAKAPQASSFVLFLCASAPPLNQPSSRLRVT
jgi:hypothetical protein